MTLLLHCICAAAICSACVSGLLTQLPLLQWDRAWEELNLDYPEEFEAIVNQCLRGKPANRSSMRDVVELLQRVPLTDPDSSSEGSPTGQS